MKLKLAFTLYKYFPFGGLQRDFLRIAQVCTARGHEVHVYTTHWQGDTENKLQIHLLTPRGWQNHSRYQDFTRKVAHALREQHHDVVIGFNKMPMLDIYYAADTCYQARMSATHHPLYRLLPRYRSYVGMEKAVFARTTGTKILLIAHQQQVYFQHYYQTEAERFYCLPPGIIKEPILQAQMSTTRQQARANFNITERDLLVLMIGSSFKTKGVDRAILALQALPKALKSRTRLMVVGQDDKSPYIGLAKQYDLHDHLHFLGGRNDIANLLYAADLLVHPAYHENTGTVLLEALVAGLPVLTVDHCGYADHVSKANAGLVLASPYEQDAMNQALAKLLANDHERKAFAKQGLSYAQNHDLYSMPEKAATIIEEVGKTKRDLLS